MSKSRYLAQINNLFQQLRSSRMNINVSSDFSGQVSQVDNLLANDKTGIVSTVYNFMVHSATVPMKIETENENLNEFLQLWQSQLLNQGASLDIPSGLRALSTENFRERWRSSLLGLNVIWGKVKFGNQGSWIVPTKMWFVDGSAVSSETAGALNNRKFFLKTNNKKTQIQNTKNKSIFIRKPFTSWHSDDVVPYLVQRGTLFNALMKNGIVQKQSDVIETIIPILLQIKAGSDNLVEAGLNPQEDDFRKLKDQIINAKDKFEQNKYFGDLIASLRHDVNLDYLMPDLKKILDDDLVKSTNRNLLSSLGLIELQGFSSTRQEAMLNPKVLVEEVTDAVLDWANLLEDVMVEMIIRNKIAHPSLSNGKIRVVPGNIKAFITDDMRAMLRSLYDRGIIAKQTAVEEIGDLIDFEVQVERRTREDDRDLQTIMKPPVIQNIEKDLDPEQIDDDNLEDQNKKPGTPEADNFNNALLENYAKAKTRAKKHMKKKKKKTDSDHTSVTCDKCDVTFNYNDVPEISMGAISCPFCSATLDQTGKVYSKKIEILFETIDDLPDDIKNALPVSAQIIWLKTFNSISQETGDKEIAIESSWSKVEETYEITNDKEKWVKKACLEDYKATMSPYTFKYFTSIYANALKQSESTDIALYNALAVIEKICAKNKNDIWVKDKTLTKSQLQAIGNSDFVEKIVDVELKEKKIALINQILKNKEK